MDFAQDGINPLQMILIGHFRLVQHHPHLPVRLLVKGDQVRITQTCYALFFLNPDD